MNWDQVYSIIEKATPVIAGGLIGLFAEHARGRLFGPRLRVDFRGTDDPAYFAITPEGPSASTGQMSAWVRVGVHNARGASALRCRGYLAKIEEWDDRDGRFRQGWFFDTAQLAWSSRGPFAYEPTDIPRGITQFLDVVSSPSDAPHPHFRLATQFKPYREAALGMYLGLFRFTIVIAGDNFKPKTIRLRYRWTGQWQGPEVAVDRNSRFWKPRKPTSGEGEIAA